MFLLLARSIQLDSPVLAATPFAPRADYADAERWADGSPSSMSAGWRPLYAVDDAGDRASGEPVVFIRANGDWSFESKEYSYPFICEVGAGSSQLQIVNSTLHDRLDAALAGLREQQTGFANASSVAELGASLVDTEARISAALQSTATAQAAQLRAAADVLDGLSGRVAALEDMVQNVTSTVQNLTMTVAALLAPVVASASPTTGCGNLGGDGCQPRVQAVGLNVTLTGANVSVCPPPRPPAVLHARAPPSAPPRSLEFCGSRGVVEF